MNFKAINIKKDRHVKLNIFDTTERLVKEIPHSSDDQDWDVIESVADMEETQLKECYSGENHENVDENADSQREVHWSNNNIGEDREKRSEK